MKDLDLLAASTAQTVVEECRAIDGVEATNIENLVTKALGTLQEGGLYAALLYLCSRTQQEEKRMAPLVTKHLLGLVGDIQSRPNVPDGSHGPVALRFITEHVCGDLDTLFLVKQVWEQALIYARYGAKASA